MHRNRHKFTHVLLSPSVFESSWVCVKETFAKFRGCKLWGGYVDTSLLLCHLSKSQGSTSVTR